MATINKIAFWGTPIKETEKAILIRTTLTEFSESKYTSDKQLNMFGDIEEYYGMVMDSEIDCEIWVPKSQILDSLQHKINKGYYIYLVNYFVVKDRINVNNRTYLVFPVYRENLDLFKNN